MLSLHSGYRQTFHDLDRLAREDHKMRMIFKELSGSFVRFGLDDRISRNFIFGIRNTLRVYTLGLTKRGAKVDD